MTSNSESSPAAGADLRRFFHDVATPLSAVALHLERASRLAKKGADPAEPLEIARRELDKAFTLCERRRAAARGHGLSDGRKRGRVVLERPLQPSRAERLQRRPPGGGLSSSRTLSRQRRGAGAPCPRPAAKPHGWAP